MAVATVGSTARYALDEFGRVEYRDPVVPVQILMVMMGFAILLINQIFTGSNVDLILVTGILCGTSYLLAYMFYLTEYYDRLWEPYFLLPEDKLFFRFYSITVGIVVIALMQNWPQHWSLYILGLFLIMYIKKANTRDDYIAAVNAQYGSFDACSDLGIKAKYKLAEAFTRNFLIWGFIFMIPFAAAMTIAYVMHTQKIDLNFGSWGTIHADTGKWIYAGVSIFITVLTIAFWKKKITMGILEMKRRVEKGDHEYFAKM
jgi:hypothetical protein